MAEKTLNTNISNTAYAIPPLTKQRLKIPILLSRSFMSYKPTDKFEMLRKMLKRLAMSTKRWMRHYYIQVEIELILQIPKNQVTKPHSNQERWVCYFCGSNSFVEKLFSILIPAMSLVKSRNNNVCNIATWFLNIKNRYHHQKQWIISTVILDLYSG